MRRRAPAVLLASVLALATGSGIAAGSGGASHHAAHSAQAGDTAPGPPAVAPAPLRPAPPGGIVTTPSNRTLYRDGPDGRFLMDGPWLFRLGGRGHLERQRSTAGWAVTTVPYAWNATNPSEAGFRAGVSWYRKDFRLPSANAALNWIVRLESVNYHADVWINGHALGGHSGTFLPFEFLLPGRFLSRRGANHLVVRVDSRHHDNSLPPSGMTKKGTPSGGWWNYAGLLREVYLRRVQKLDFSSVQVRPQLACPTCTARMAYTVNVTNYASSRQTVHVGTRFGGRPGNLGTHAIAPGATATFTTSVSVPHPSLWSPDHPALYNVTLDAHSSGGRAHYFLQSGIRSIRVINGHVFLNNRPLHLRGVGLQEDSLQNGFAIDNATRARYIAEVKDLGGTFIRSQYPLHPYEEELADQQGILLWSEIPVFSVKATVLRSTSFVRFAEDQLRQNIVDNGSHPSVMVWSIANELSSRPGPAQKAYIQSAVALAHRLDPSRPVSLAVAGYPSVPCQSIFRKLQILGVNDYFGWYPGPSGQIADRSLLSAYLDRAHACYPRQGLFVTEFGAEANRDGPVQERGTFEFQSDFVNYHLGVFATKTYLSAVSYWALEEFRVRPGWDGGNPHPDPPIHEKGLVSMTGFKKPAYFDVQRIYRATRQIG
jgi:beta-glucuronidase